MESTVSECKEEHLEYVVECKDNYDVFTANIIIKNAGFKTTLSKYKLGIMTN